MHVSMCPLVARSQGEFAILSGDVVISRMGVMKCGCWYVDQTRVSSPLTPPTPWEMNESDFLRFKSHTLTGITFERNTTRRLSLRTNLVRG